MEEYLGHIVELLPESQPLSPDTLQRIESSASQTLQILSYVSGFISAEDLFLCQPPELVSLTTLKPGFESPQSALVSAYAEHS